MTFVKKKLCIRSIFSDAEKRLEQSDHAENPKSKKKEKKKKSHHEKVSNLMFYAQSTSMVIIRASMKTAGESDKDIFKMETAHSWE